MRSISGEFDIETDWDSIHEQAEEIITSYVSKYQDIDKIKEIEDKEKEIIKNWKEKLEGD